MAEKTMQTQQMQEAVTYRMLRDGSVKILREAGILDALSDTQLLMEYFLGLTRMGFLLKAGETVPPDKLTEYFEALSRRAKREPLQHITGEQYFCDFPFIVNRDVLIPRQDTELLVRLALQEAEQGNARSVLDLCTGSGCIGVSMKRFCPHLQVTLSDLSEAALAIARKNAQKAEVSVTICQGDLFEPITKQYDIIVSNPPYIKTAEIETLDEEVKLYDPHMALDGAGDGLYFYRKLAAEAPSYLQDGGSILMEIGYDQGQSVPDLLAANGWKEIKVVKDLAGLDRVVMAKKG